MTNFIKKHYLYSANAARAARQAMLRKPVTSFCLLLACIIASVFAAPLVFATMAVKGALLYAWGDSGVYSGRATQAVYTKKGVRILFVVPSNPQTSDQTNIRNFFGSFSALWRSLTGSQQAAWRNLKFKASNRLGRSIEYAGKQAYVRLNTMLALIGAGQIDDAPILDGVLAPEVGAPAIDVSATTLDMDLSNADNTMGVIVYASLPLLAGRTQARTKIVYAISDSTLYSASGAWVGYQNHWGYTPQAGDNIILHCQYVDNVSGQPSPQGGRGIINVTA